MTTVDVLEVALDALRQGLNVLPPKQNGSKRPDCEWKKYETQRVTEEELRSWYGSNGRTGVGVLCGAISGNLELFEFDEWDAYESFVITANAVGLGELVERVKNGYEEISPNDGVHWLLRCDDGVKGNTKLAKRPKRPKEMSDPDDDQKVLIETRGEGGYCITAPSHGTVHPTGGAYRLLHGGFDTIATVTGEERQALHDLACTFDLMPKVDRAPPIPPRADRALDGNRPGDDYNERATWAEVLEPHGWTQLYTGVDGTTYWRRPGKSGPGPSATTDHNGTAYLYVFSTSTTFEAERGYSRFSAFALLNHGGDVEAAARALAERGFGTTRSPSVSVQRGADGEEAPIDLFRCYTMTELLSMPRTFAWLVRRMLTRPTYAQIAGPLKVLKSHFADAICIGVASGRPVLDVFEVDTAGPVVAYVGEGGRAPVTRRLERMAAAMGVSLADIPLVGSFDGAPITSLRFQESLQRDLRDHEPRLVTIDPLYAFHGLKVKASDLHQEGSLLSSVSAPCMEADTTLLIANHWNQTGSGGGLSRITQAGSGEWVDSWLLVNHREPPDVEGGHFRLLLEAGSRQWGGNAWDIDFDLGRFNHDTSEFDGDISWAVTRHDPGAGDGDEQKVLAMVEEQPLSLTREEIAKGLGGRLERARQVVDRVERRGSIEKRLVDRKRSDGQLRKVWVFALTSEAGRGGTAEEEA